MMIQREITEALLDNLAKRFQFHGNTIYGNLASENSSPLYAHLALAASHDAEILALVANADFSTQVTNLLFGAVQFLLLTGVQHPLATYYPNLTKDVKAISEAYPAFRDFCLQHAEKIRELVTSHRVQTNEVGRCTALLPAFTILAERQGEKPLALIEVGASAGLLLHWDSYGYHYEGLGRIGSSKVELQCYTKGSKTPPLPQTFPSVAERMGLELNPIDINNAEELLWLKALIWPEHTDRQKLLDAALSIAQAKDIRMIAGNAAETLGAALREIAETSIPCIFHSYTFAQMPRAIREAVLAEIFEFSNEREVFRISQEWLEGWEQPRLELFSYRDGEVEAELLAYSESHGRWIEWLA